MDTMTEETENIKDLENRPDFEAYDDSKFSLYASNLSKTYTLDDGSTFQALKNINLAVKPN